MLIRLGIECWLYILCGMLVVAMLRFAYALYGYRAFCKRHAHDALPPYTLIRTCAGTWASLTPNLQSILHMHGPLPQQYILGAAAGDVALSELANTASLLRERGLAAELRITELRPHLNGKAVQLAQLSPLANTPWVIYADADVDFTHFPMDAFLRYALYLQHHHPQMGALWSPFIPQPQQTWSDRLFHALLKTSLHSFVLTGWLMPQNCVGKLLLINAAQVNTTALWHYLQRLLGEDMALAMQLRQQRFSIHTWPGWVRTNPAPNSLISLFIRLHRWLWVIRLERPHLLLAYPLLFSPWAWICTLSVAEPRYFPFFILTHAVVSASLAGFCRLSAATTSAAWQCTPWALLRAWLNTIAAEILLLCAWCYMMLGPRRLAWGRQHLSLSRKYLDQPPNP